DLGLETGASRDTGTSATAGGAGDAAVGEEPSLGTGAAKGDDPSLGAEPISRGAGAASGAEGSGAGAWVPSARMVGANVDSMIGSHSSMPSRHTYASSVTRPSRHPANSSASVMSSCSSSLKLTVHISSPLANNASETITRVASSSSSSAKEVPSTMI